tara:strand:- start:1283 stop:1654 length:372 start_codon:yes stop_codon:yes gene_type:complete
MKDFWETQQYPKTGKDFTRIEKWTLFNIIRSMETKGHRKMTSSERVLMEALYNVEESYRKTDLYFKTQERSNQYLKESQQLTEQLIEVTKERDSLLDKMKEASIASGLFIKSVRDKLGWDKEK